jgi:hypothetical protein
MKNAYRELSVAARRLYVIVIGHLGRTIVSVSWANSNVPLK